MRLPRWLQLCLSKDVMGRAFKLALVVGTILVLINQGDALLQGHLDADRVFKMILTFSVPYCVSTYSSVSALLQVQSPDEKIF